MRIGNSGDGADAPYQLLGDAQILDAILADRAHIDLRRNAEIKNTRYVLVEKAEGLSYTLLNLATADTFHNGQIDWRETDGPDVSRRTYLTYENGFWISRDGYGHIYDRH